MNQADICDVMTPTRRMIKFGRMNIPPVDLTFIRDQFRELAAEVAERWEPAADQSSGEDPAQLSEAMAQLVDMLARIENGDGQPAERFTLGEYGLHLIDELADRAKRLGLEPIVASLESLALAFGLWLARTDTEIRNLGRIANAVNRLTDQATQARTLASIHACCNELIDAASPALAETRTSGSGNAWCALVRLRAVVATRSCNPDAMIAAFEAIVEHMPDAAPKFFSENMERTAIADYPEPVRAVIQRFYLAHATPHHLH
jgi:hypothetical protein